MLNKKAKAKSNDFFIEINLLNEKAKIAKLTNDLWQKTKVFFEMRDMIFLNYFLVKIEQNMLKIFMIFFLDKRLLLLYFCKELKINIYEKTYW